MKGLIIATCIDAVLLVIVGAALLFINSENAVGMSAMTNLGLFAVLGLAAIVLVVVLIILIALLIIKANNN